MKKQTSEKRGKIRREKDEFISSFIKDKERDVSSESKQKRKSRLADESSQSVLGLSDTNIKKELNILIN